MAATAIPISPFVSKLRPSLQALIFTLYIKNDFCPGQALTENFSRADVV